MLLAWESCQSPQRKMRRPVALVSQISQIPTASRLPKRISNRCLPCSRSSAPYRIQRRIESPRQSVIWASLRQSVVWASLLAEHLTSSCKLSECKPSHPRVCVHFSPPFSEMSLLALISNAQHSAEQLWKMLSISDKHIKLWNSAHHKSQSF